MAKKLSPPPPQQPKKKTFRLDDYACNQLTEIQASYGMATENEAINYVLQSYLQTVETLRLTGNEAQIRDHELDTLKEKIGYMSQLAEDIFGLTHIIK